ncbi:MAG: glycoside hydrolase family 1 protein [Chloroflexota bacterium]|nr:glycoside hydrolase family 1 protein [Chloroflexota bacterium]
MAEYTDISFPPGFLWGCATSSHQVEGNCTNNDWWAWEREGGHIREGGVSGLACDHYNRFDEDFALSQELGHNAHRISIEWSRIEPQEGRWDMAEVDHYRRVLESMHRHGLTPFVTLHHFTNPLWFRDRGGWLNPQAPDLIARYAGFMARELGDAVPFWLTINEPMVTVTAGYLLGMFPPCVRDMAQALLVGKHLLLAHGRMYQAIKEATSHRPLVGPVLNMSDIQPQDPDSEGDRQAAQTVDTLLNEYFLVGLSLGVIPPPAGGGEEVAGLKGAWDFIGLNYYSRELISQQMLELISDGTLAPAGFVRHTPPGAELSLMGWEVYPVGFYKLIKRLSAYRVPIYVTENGTSVVDDRQRISYILRHLRQVHRAIGEGVDVRAYLHWSLTDNFEWAEGWQQWFGLVALEPGTLNRKPRPAAYVFRDIARANAITAEQFRAYLG